MSSVLSLPVAQRPVGWGPHPRPPLTPLFFLAWGYLEVLSWSVGLGPTPLTFGNKVYCCLVFEYVSSLSVVL